MSEKCPVTPLSRSMRHHRREAVHVHPRGAGRLDAERTVLDHDTPLGGDAHPFGGVEEQVRGRFSLPHILGAEDPLLLEPLVEAGVPVPCRDLLVASGRGDAVRDAVGDERAQQLVDSLDRGQPLLLERVEGAPVELLVEVLGQFLAGPLLHEVVDPVDGGPHVVAEGLVVRGGVAELGEVVEPARCWRSAHCRRARRRCRR